MSEAFAPAKINLTLVITGVRPDGFHNLVSLVAPLEFGDTLRLRIAPGAKEDSLECEAPGVPTDGSNLVLKAAHAFRRRVPAAPFCAFTLEKRIPHGAGLGGGSSDAAAALRLLNAACGGSLSSGELAEIAAEVGSDAPLFLVEGPVIMRGRGERVTPLGDAEAAALRGRRVLIFKPAFGVATAEAYRAMRERGGDYLSENEAEALLAAWRRDPGSPPPCLNNMTGAVGAKHRAIPALLDLLRREHGLDAHMSGSGSACFALPAPGRDLAPVVAAIRDAWGGTAFVLETRLR